MGTVLPKRVFGGHDATGINVAPLLVRAAGLDAAGVFALVGSGAEGLTGEQAAARLVEHGPNVLAREQRPGFLRLLWRSVINPLVILLAVLATVSFLTADPRAGSMMVLMIVLSVGLKLYQEARADSAAAKLKAMISVNATVVRDGAPSDLPLSQLVPGDLIHLAAGDMIPADVRVVQAKDLFVTQGSLTGESFPVEKHGVPLAAQTAAPLDLPTVAFLGTSVESGSAVAVVVATG
ncbi:MAG TPA: cation-transporting P-type ATPase, partial [Polyangia bacterium]|nr:cation-transporting P-type ATPase [Polyangia bacterium]